MLSTLSGINVQFLQKLELIDTIDTKKNKYNYFTLANTNVLKCF
jgi:hypothetical protein